MSHFLRTVCLTVLEINGSKLLNSKPTIKHSPKPISKPHNPFPYLRLSLMSTSNLLFSFWQMAIFLNVSMPISCILLLCPTLVACQSLSNSGRNNLFRTRWNGTTEPNWDTHADVHQCNFYHFYEITNCRQCKVFEGTRSTFIWWSLIYLAWAWTLMHLLHN